MRGKLDTQAIPLPYVRSRDETPHAFPRQTQHGVPPCSAGPGLKCRRSFSTGGSMQHGMITKQGGNEGMAEDKLLLLGETFKLTTCQRRPRHHHPVATHRHHHHSHHLHLPAHRRMRLGVLDREDHQPPAAWVPTATNTTKYAATISTAAVTTAVSTARTSVAIVHLLVGKSALVASLTTTFLPIKADATASTTAAVGATATVSTATSATVSTATAATVSTATAATVSTAAAATISTATSAFMGKAALITTLTVTLLPVEADATLPATTETTAALKSAAAPERPAITISTTTAETAPVLCNSPCDLLCAFLALCLVINFHELNLCTIFQSVAIFDR
eukprot:CAMPEP_0119311196 /NCGR_PEP_ID=MMETSP1333-20130426/21967_1 /TAXON_ID=418940 /ORGANISM="Scyphosphaera apsteinii, Strain RCC1455" /LENGTH=335 /DNA_ID=CAMNT_0007315523 /DNA_START=113 /DNA_END=1122 /DNA_ORIENTATION=-